MRNLSRASSTLLFINDNAHPFEPAVVCSSGGHIIGNVSRWCNRLVTSYLATCLKSEYIAECRIVWCKAVTLPLPLCSCTGAGCIACRHLLTQASSTQAGLVCPASFALAISAYRAGVNTRTSGRWSRKWDLLLFVLGAPASAPSSGD